jgi:hypothetical protein
MQLATFSLETAYNLDRSLNFPQVITMKFSFPGNLSWNATVPRNTISEPVADSKHVLFVLHVSGT